MLGQRIKELRAKDGMSQKDLADYLGVAYSTMSQYENEERTPSDEIKIKLANLFDVSLDYLLGRTNRRIQADESQLPEEFTTPEDAMRFILEQNVIMGFGGFDIERLSNEEIMNFANELLYQLQLLSYKYKK